MSTDPVPNSRVRVSDMNDPDPSTSASASASTVWDWGSLLDFTIYDNDLLTFPGDPSDEDLLIPPPPPPPLHPAAAESPAPAVSNAAGSSKVVRVRKRDPRLVCENFLAGRVPCACPELDAMMLEEEEEAAAAADGGGGGGRKRVRKAVEVGVLRCQVEGCEADIRELKGYHRRHRVCLMCANAVAVVIDGEEKRYCQQCGKFHILPDFDEGKRSCRRKLERHNKRRRRRPIDFDSGVEKDSQTDLSTEVTLEDEPKEVNGYASETVVGKNVNYKETLLESEVGQGSPISSLPKSQTMQRDNKMPSTPASIDDERDNSKSASTICDNSRNTYSSECPTGRISFKLYDWNPAEFPRRLRLQIFQWLASMPVELEGYVRPGCTILTIFIAMPQLKWEKLSQDAAFYIRDLISAPESLFLGRGNIFIFLGNKIYHILKDGTSLMSVKMKAKAPRIHYVHPNYFEAGKPIEFIACGSNLDQRNFRFLVSFAGKYMVYDSCALSHGEIMSSDGTEGNSFHSSNHEMFRIRISQTDSKTFGPAFVEVENESGISNFIPILVGNKHICKELGRLQVTLIGSLADSLVSQIAVHGANPRLCELFIEKQAAMSELIVDIAWLLKGPCPEEGGAILSSINFQRLTSLLKFAVQNELVNILEVILNYFDVMIARIKYSDCAIPDTVSNLLMGYVNCAKEILKKSPPEVRSEPDSGFVREMDIVPKSYMKNAKVQDEEASSTPCLCSTLASISPESDENIALVGKACNERKHRYPQQQVVNWPQEPRGTSSPFKFTRTPCALFVMVSVAMCFGACLVFLHPTKSGQLAVSIKRCLFGNP